MALTKYVVQPPAGNNLYSYLDQELRKIQRAIDSLISNYAEGTFIPVAKGQTVAGVGTYLVQRGWYTRIGNRCIINGRLVWTAHTGTGGLQFDGLPFPVSNIGGLNPYSAITYGPDNASVPVGGLWLCSLPATSSMYLAKNDGTAATIAAVADIIFGGEYLI